MKPSQPQPDPARERDASAPDASRDRPAAERSGGAPAVEEDIGTEGAGTEPRDSSDVERDTGTRSSDKAGRNPKETL